MLLTVDIGNTNVSLGVFKEGKLISAYSVKTDLSATEDNYFVILSGVLAKDSFKFLDFNYVAISSVVPNLTLMFESLFLNIMKKKPLIVGPGIKTGIAIKTSNPSAVGADRIVNAVAIKELYKTPALVVDFGTATTFDFIDKSGAYCGGVICPGIGISLEALVSKTSKLPRIELSWPEKVVGNDTVPAMRSGLMFGYLSLVEGLIEKIKLEVGGLDQVIATGGWGKIFSERSKLIDIYEPNLILKGLEFLVRLNHE